MPYDLTYKWNIMNKTNKQAKQNQRHGNKECTDRDGGGSSQGNCIMDTWTTGWGVSEGGGRAGQEGGTEGKIGTTVIEQQ